MLCSTFLSGNEARIELRVCYILAKSKSIKCIEGAHLQLITGRVLILFPGALGDFICFLPVLECFTRVESIDVLAREEFSGVAPPYANVKSLERCEIRSLFVPRGGRDKKVRRFFECYDCTYSWMGNGDLTFRQELQTATRGKVRLFQFRSTTSEMHQVDYYLSCLQDGTAMSVPHVVQRPDSSQWAESYWAENSLNFKPVLAIAPGSGAREKNWPVESFEAIARWWREKLGGQVIIILGPVEEERGGYDCFCCETLVIRGMTLARLSAMLARCSLYLGNDSGLSHLAAALGLPTAAIFGPSNVVQWTPRGKDVLILRQNVPCSPCTVSTMKACTHRRCLTGLTPPEVIRQLEQWPALVNLTIGGINDYS
jgi:ADP-heptose:LPS heptosyltransferase